MSSIWTWLQGKKTFIVAILIAVFNLGVASNWWMPEDPIVLAVNAILAAFGFGFLRSGMKTEVKKLNGG
jgi:hypothetical protein